MAGPESATAVPVALRPDMAQPPPPAALAPPKADVKPPAEAKPLAPVPPAKPADKAAPPIDPAKLLEATKLLEQMCPSLEPMKESREQFAAAPPPPRTIDHLKFAAVDLAAIVKNIPGAKYYPHETYTGGGSADVIRAPSGKPIIRKTVEDGHKIIESYMKPDELAYELRKLPPAQLALVREVLNGQVGEISPATIQAHEQAEQAKQVEAQRLAQVFAAASQLPAPTGVISFGKAQAIGIGQHELGRTDASSPKPILGSFGARPCLIVAIYNPKTHSATLAHIDSLTPDSELSRMISSMRGDSKEPLEIHIAGGDPSSREQVSRLIDTSRKEPNTKIVTTDIGPAEGSRSLAIDTRTGEVTTRFSHEQLDLGPNFDRRANLLQYQMQSRPLDIVRDSRIPQKTK